MMDIQFSLGFMAGAFTIIALFIIMKLLGFV